MTNSSATASLLWQRMFVDDDAPMGELPVINELTEQLVDTRWSLGIGRIKQNEPEGAIGRKLRSSIEAVGGNDAHAWRLQGKGGEIVLEHVTGDTVTLDEGAAVRTTRKRLDTQSAAARKSIEHVHVGQARADASRWTRRWTRARDRSSDASSSRSGFR